ncbi:DUF72 domain-containing protein [Duganella sp. FT92W]|uniref:DUF72 domain-containing protein n=2 Tax=Pseudoduganella rivuli TaxID=2666085 RepID=A0A7X2IPY6_9BURK|nr:DUF72 domain-containing protein [Pseudoduganella rivuli]
MAVARIGCAGWSIPKSAAMAFPIGGTHLERYGAVFNSVEINSSFYRPHQVQTYARWAASVPETFRFSVKAPRTMTHVHHLLEADAPMARFAGEVAGLGDKLGCVLLQFPPSLMFDAVAAGSFFALARRHFDTTMVACEGRHPTWFSDTATGVLREHGITRVIADPPAGQPDPHVATTKSTYLRLHGTPRVYYSPYGPEDIDWAARIIAGRLKAGHDAWCIFDNTAEGHAMPNAVSLQQRLSEISSRRA